MVSKYPLMTFRGSTRFKDAFFDALRSLTLAGCIVINFGIFGRSRNDEAGRLAPKNR